MSTSTAGSLPPAWDRFQSRALVAGVAGLGLSAAVAVVRPGVFFPAYLVAFLFWLGISLGSLGALSLHYLVGGAWGFLIRRPLEAAVLTIPLMALFFLPIAAGLPTLYPWARPDVVRGDPSLSHKAAYLNVPFFLVRAAIYFGFWSILALILNRGSSRQDRTESPAPTWRLQTVSAPGLAFHFAIVTFAAIDWGMSIEPKWFSTIYGPMIFIGQSLSGLAAMTIVAARLAKVKPLSDVAKPDAFNELGNLMLAFTMFWAYMTFSQYLIIWSGNLTEEIPWYLDRSRGAWRYVCLALMFGHFFIPFFMLLSRDVKRDGDRLRLVAALLLVMQFVNDLWLIVPAYRGGAITAATAVLATIGIGGLWLTVFVRRLRSRPLLPSAFDPLLTDVLEHQEAH